MNNLTGAFIYALEKNINPDFIKRGFLNAGYSPQEIEEAFLEAQQINAISSQQMINQPKKSSAGKVLLIIFLTIFILAIAGFFIWYFFFGGKESELISSFLEKISEKINFNK